MKVDDFFKEVERNFHNYTTKVPPSPIIRITKQGKETVIVDWSIIKKVEAGQEGYLTNLFVYSWISRQMLVSEVIGMLPKLAGESSDQLWKDMRDLPEIRVVNADRSLRKKLNEAINEVETYLEGVAI